MSEDQNARSASAVDHAVGARVKLRRVELGMSQTELALKLGITFQQLQKYERGVNRISAARLYFIAQALDVPLAYFFRDVGTDEGEDGHTTTKVIVDSESLRLLKAFNRISNAQTRRLLVDLIDTVSAPNLPTNHD